ncbi:RNase H domain-containing protein [Trichonephila clavipes]|nr:RNase H domain-containing protein [Trichonephila clavipes]
MTTSIVQLLNSLSANVKIFFQWVPWHVNICGDEIADCLARESSHKDSTFDGCITFSEIATRVKQDIISCWKQAPVHEWYEESPPGAALLGIGRKRDETSLTRGFQWTLSSSTACGRS